MSVEWAMFWLTCVYVVATILICFFNARSAIATQAQVAESQRQFEETTRFDFMPFFQFERGNGSCDTDYYLTLSLDNQTKEPSVECRYSARIKNIGRGSAINLAYSWKNSVTEYDRGDFVFSDLQNGDMRTLSLEIIVPKEEPTVCCAELKLRYMDLLNHKYTQKIVFSFDYSSSSPRISDIRSEMPVLDKGVDKNNV